MNVKIVEFSNDRPFIVIVEKDGIYNTYDFEWSKKYKRCLYHYTGSGGCEHTLISHDYWASDDAHIIVPEYISPVRREHYDTVALFEDSWEVETQWCEQCEDNIDEDEPCVHLHWHDELGWWVEVIYCCDELLKGWDIDFNVVSGKVTKGINNVEHDKCPFCGGLPTFKEE